MHAQATLVNRTMTFNPEKGGGVDDAISKWEKQTTPLIHAELRVAQI